MSRFFFFLRLTFLQLSLFVRVALPVSVLGKARNSFEMQAGGRPGGLGVLFLEGVVVVVAVAVFLQLNSTYGMGVCVSRSICC